MATRHTLFEENSVLNTPFTKELLDSAAAYVAQYHFVLEQRDGRYRFSSLEFPLVAVSATSADEGLRLVREATTVTVATILEAGEVPPKGSRRLKREEQINIRVTVEEKRILEDATKRQGYQSVSDFVRNASIQVAHSENSYDIKSHA